MMFIGEILMGETKKFFKGFVFATRGIFYAISHERNMRFHITLMAYMYTYLLAFDFFEVTRTQFAIIFVTNALVLSAEMINTAIERTVDLACSSPNSLAKHAKDVAAGAVWVSAIFSLIVAAAILWQPSAFSKIYEYYSSRIWLLVILAISFVVSGVFIFAFPKIFKKSGEK